MKKFFFYIGIFAISYPLSAFAAGGASDAGCNAKIDVLGGTAQAYKYSPTDVVKGLHSSGTAQVSYGPTGGYACLGLGLIGVSSQQKYKYHALLEDERLVALKQLGVGLAASSEFDFWRLLKSMKTFPFSPFIGAEASIGLAANQVSVDRTDDALTTRQNGRFYHYGLRLGIRAHLYRRFGVQVGVLQGTQVYTFSEKNMSFQMLRYDVGLSWGMGR